MPGKSSLRPTAGVHGFRLAYPLDLVADVNADGTVDGADLEIWQRDFGTQNNATCMNGDFDNDGAVTGSDFLIWQRSVGQSIDLTDNHMMQIANGACYTIAAIPLRDDIEAETVSMLSINANDANSMATFNDEDSVVVGTMTFGDPDAMVVAMSLQGVWDKLDRRDGLNGDGPWGGLDKQIVTLHNISIRNNGLLLHFPSYMIAGTSYGRFPLRTTDG